MTEVRRATPADGPAVVATLAEAFFDDPVAAFLFPDVRSRARLLKRFFEIQVTRNYLRRGMVLVADGGASLWLPPLAPPPNLTERVAHSLFSLRLGDRRRDARTLTTLLEGRHPSERHWYLGAIGVRPDLQGQGVGSALLAAGLAEVDRTAVSVYLEASRPESARLYSRFGFEALGLFDPTASGLAGPKLTLMLRPRIGAR